jgi:hypothetical protein
VDTVAFGLHRLAAAQTKDALVEALWDLRDSAYDEPGSWSGLQALELLQGLAQELEQASADDQIPIRVLAMALEKALDPRLGRR